MAGLYKKDFYAWTKQQADLIRNKSFDQLDFQHLLEEVEGMGNQNKSELRNRLSILFVHLLKWKYQANLRTKSWLVTIIQQRLEIVDLIEDNPSLKHCLDELFEKAYKKAIPLTIAETGISPKKIPSVCEWDLNQVLDDQFLPN